MTPLPENYQEKSSLKQSILTSVPNGILEEDRVQLPFGKIYEAMIGKCHFSTFFLFILIIRIDQYGAGSVAPVHFDPRKRVVQKLRVEQDRHRPTDPSHFEDSFSP